MPKPIVLDTNCIKHLRSADARARFRRQLRMIDAFPMMSIINVIEVFKHPTPAYRHQLQLVVRDLAAHHGLAPWPYSLMEHVGHAHIAGRDSFDLESLGVSPLQEPVSAVLRTAAVKEATTMEGTFARMLHESRSPIRRFLKERKIHDEWSGVRDFLDRFWMRSEQIDTWIARIWQMLELPDPPLCDAMRVNPTWRLFLEGYGVAAFEQAFAANQPRPFGHFDLLQLLYVTGFPHSLFVTDEMPLRRAAEVLFQPVRGARVLSWHEFADP